MSVQRPYVAACLTLFVFTASTWITSRSAQAWEPRPRMARATRLPVVATPITPAPPAPTAPTPTQSLEDDIPAPDASSVTGVQAPDSNPGALTPELLQLRDKV